jgi:hypothetical protein
MTPKVKAALNFLSIYLVVLLILLVVRFAQSC